MQSPDKVRQAIENAAQHFPALQRSAAGMHAIALGAIAPFLPSLIQQALALVPDDADALDALLESAACQVLALRSDLYADSTAEPEPVQPPPIVADPEAPLRAQWEREQEQGA